jgi:hypothetical protein
VPEFRPLHRTARPLPHSVLLAETFSASLGSLSKVCLLHRKQYSGFFSFCTQTVKSLTEAIKRLEANARESDFDLPLSATQRSLQHSVSCGTIIVDHRTVKGSDMSPCGKFQFDDDACIQRLEISWERSDAYRGTREYRLYTLPRTRTWSVGHGLTSVN